jgi:hypothetical protein
VIHGRKDSSSSLRPRIYSQQNEAGRRPSGQVHREGTIGANRNELDWWMKTFPQPWTAAMEATIFTGWIYDHLLPHAAQVKVDSSTCRDGPWNELI